MLRDVEVAVIGGSSMGTALAHVAAKSGHSAALWCSDSASARQVAERFNGAGRGTDEAPVRVTHVIADVVRDAALVSLAVPSHQFRETARSLASLSMTDRALLSSTKGFEPASHDRMSEILAQETGAVAVGAIAGANITPDMLTGRLTTLVVASRVAEVGAAAKRCLESPQLRVRLEEDLLSIELAAALKNVVAVGVGIATGLDLGFNARSIVFACGLEEITALGVALGATPRAFAGLAGAGDLFLTASSPESLNRRLGIELGRGARLAEIVAQLPEVPEGIGSVRACRALARRHGVRLPIAEVVAAILEGECDARAIEAALGETPCA